jgi:hypothetical protein
MQDFFWSFYNQRNQTRYDGFSTTQAKSFVTSLIPGTVPDWIVWKEGTPEWLPLNSYPELFSEHSDFTYAAESEFNLAGTATEKTALTKPGLESENTFTNHDPLDKETALKRGLEQEMPGTRTDLLDGIVPEDDFIDISDIEIVDLKFERSGKAPKPELRKQARYRHRVLCEVDYGGKSILKAETLDISMGGLLLNQVLPEGSKTQVKVRLMKGGQSINTLCQNIPDRQGRPSRRFRFIDVDKMELLRTWLINR